MFFHFLAIFCEVSVKEAERFHSLTIRPVRGVRLSGKAASLSGCANPAKPVKKSTSPSLLRSNGVESDPDVVKISRFPEFSQRQSHIGCKICCGLQNYTTFHPVSVFRRIIKKNDVVKNNCLDYFLQHRFLILLKMYSSTVGTVAAAATGTAEPAALLSVLTAVCKAAWQSCLAMSHKNSNFLVSCNIDPFFLSLPPGNVA